MGVPGVRALIRAAVERGVTLIELIVALTLAGVILTSIWSAWSLLGRSSADPLVARQSLAILICASIACSLP